MTQPETRRFDILQEPRGSDYHAVVRATVMCARWASVIVRPSTRTAFTTRLGECVAASMICCVRTRAWPGTVTREGGVEMVLFPTGTAAVHALLADVAGLYSWIGPDLPEDLCMYGADGGVVLESCAHERFASVYLDDAQESQWRGEASGVALRAREPGPRFVLGRDVLGALNGQC